jgi:hypothetical protein
MAELRQEFNDKLDLLRQEEIKQLKTQSLISNEEEL